jgi:hypothetical protein
VLSPKLLSKGLLNPLVFLDGTVVQVKGSLWEPSSHVTIEEVIDIKLAPSLLDDGDVEPHPRPIDLSTFGPQPTSEYLWVRWIKSHIPERNYYSPTELESALLHYPTYQILLTRSKIWYVIISS